MKYLVFSVFILIAIHSNAQTSADKKIAKQKKRYEEVARKNLNIRKIGSDTIYEMRVPFGEIKSSMKYSIVALQYQLGELATKQKTVTSARFRSELEMTKAQIEVVENGDSLWTVKYYLQEHSYYRKLNSRTIISDSLKHVRVDSIRVAEPGRGSSNTYTPSASPSSTSTYHQLHTGPRGGVYYINKNGNKTYVKKRK